MDEPERAERAPGTGCGDRTRGRAGWDQEALPCEGAGDLEGVGWRSFGCPIPLEQPAPAGAAHGAGGASGSLHPNPFQDSMVRSHGSGSNKHLPAQIPSFPGSLQVIPHSAPAPGPSRAAHGAGATASKGVSGAHGINQVGKGWKSPLRAAIPTIPKGEAIHARSTLSSQPLENQTLRKEPPGAGQRRRSKYHKSPQIGMDGTPLQIGMDGDKRSTRNPDGHGINACWDRSSPRQQGEGQPHSCFQSLLLGKRRDVPGCSAGNSSHPGP